jgi:hypothetical protein
MGTLVGGALGMLVGGALVDGAGAGNLYARKVDRVGVL